MTRITRTWFVPILRVFEPVVDRLRAVGHLLGELDELLVKAGAFG